LQGSTLKNFQVAFLRLLKNKGRQMQKFSRQIVQEEKLRLEPHLISTVVRLPLDCGCHCGTDRNNRSEEREKTKTPEDFGLTILPQAVNEQRNKYISGLLSPGTTASVASHARNCTMRRHQTKTQWRTAM